MVVTEGLLGVLDTRPPSPNTLGSAVRFPADYGRRNRMTVTFKLVTGGRKPSRAVVVPNRDGRALHTRDDQEIAGRSGDGARPPWHRPQSGTRQASEATPARPHAISCRRWPSTSRPSLRCCLASMSCRFCCSPRRAADWVRSQCRRWRPGRASAGVPRAAVGRKERETTVGGAAG